MSDSYVICPQCGGIAPRGGDHLAPCPYWGCGADAYAGDGRPLEALGAVSYALVIQSPDGDRRVPLEETRYRLGREAGEEQGTIAVPSKSVEVEHAVLTFAENEWRLEALADVRIGERAAEGQVGLRPGDVIWLGRAALQLRATALQRGDSGELPAAAPDAARRTIWFSKRGVRIGSGADCDTILPGLSALHARVAPTGGKWLLVDEAGLGDVCVNSRAVLQTHIAPSDLVEIGPYAYRGIDGGLKPYRGPAGYALECVNVSYDAPNGRRLLDRIWLEIEANEFIGIVGPSGCGKSTLLKLLAGYYAAADEPGSAIRVDGLPVREVREEFRQGMGYVPQDDILHQSLPVRRALRYAAELRLGLPRAELNERVDEVIQLVQLEGCRRAPIAQLSGGQRKRVNVAAELVARPRILFMDEPTSGLDPGTETDLMHQFRAMANRNQTIVCATHVMENADLFDKIAVLRPTPDGPGVLDFFGPPSELRRHYNIERLVDLYRRIDPELYAAAKKPSAAPAQGLATRMMLGIAAVLSAPFRAVSRGLDLFANWLWRPPRAVETRVPLVERGRAAWRQFSVLARRYGQVLYRDRQFLFLLVLAQPILLGLMIAITVPIDRKDSSRDLLLFLGVVASIWLGLNCAIRELVREREIFRRERQAGLGLLPYLSSKVLVLALVGCLQCAIIAGILSSRPEVDRETFRKEVLHRAELEDALPRQFNWSRAVQLGFPTPRAFQPADAARQFAGCYLSFLAALAIGLAVSAVVRSSESAIAFLPILTIPQILFSRIIIGFGKTSNFVDNWPRLPAFKELVECFARGDTFSVLGAMLARLMPSYYGFEFLRAAEGADPGKSLFANTGALLANGAALLVIAAIGLAVTLAVLRSRESEG